MASLLHMAAMNNNNNNTDDKIPREQQKYPLLKNHCQEVLSWSQLCVWYSGSFFNVFWDSGPLCLCSSSSALHFFRLFFLCPTPFNRDDRQLLARAMASDFSVAIFCI
jgi:hypothetical protein